MTSDWAELCQTKPGISDRVLSWVVPDLGLRSALYALCTWNTHPEIQSAAQQKHLKPLRLCRALRLLPLSLTADREII